MLVLPVWVNERVSDDLGMTIVLHVFLLSLPFTWNCSRASKEFWIGGVDFVQVCAFVFVFFPWEVYNLNCAFELHRTGSVTWYSTLRQIAELSAAAELSALETAGLAPKAGVEQPQAKS